MFFWWISCQIWKPLLHVTPPFLNIALPFPTKSNRTVSTSFAPPSPGNLGGVILNTSPSLVLLNLHLLYSGHLTSLETVSSPHVLLWLPRSTRCFRRSPCSYLCCSPFLFSWLTPTHPSRPSVRVPSLRECPSVHFPYTFWGTLDFLSWLLPQSYLYTCLCFSLLKVYSLLASRLQVPWGAETVPAAFGVLCVCVFMCVCLAARSCSLNEY